MARHSAMPVKPEEETDKPLSHSARSAVSQLTLSAPKTHGRRPFSLSEDVEIEKLWATHSAAEIARILGRSRASIIGRVHRMGFKKDGDVFVLQKEHVAWISRVIEAVREAQCRLDEKENEPILTLSRMRRDFNKSFGLTIRAEPFRRAYETEVKEGRLPADPVEARGKPGPKKMVVPVSALINQRRGLGGCEFLGEGEKPCGAPTVGRYCECHARKSYPRNMSSEGLRSFF